MELKENSENSLEDKNGGITGVILVIVSVCWDYCWWNNNMGRGTP